METHSSPPRGPSRRPELVRSALVFYGLLAAAACLWRLVWFGEPILFAPGRQAAIDDPLRDLVSGVAAAVLVIALSHEFTRHTQVGERLAHAMADLLGPLGRGEIAVLALTSGIAEELFFRGALQPRVGLVVASLVFGAVHFVPRREFLVWTLFSVAAGFLLGGLFEATGNLIAPVVTHVVVNGVNLTLLVRDRFGALR